MGLTLLACANDRLPESSDPVAAPRIIEVRVEGARLRDMHESTLRDLFPQLTADEALLDSCLWEDDSKGVATFTPQVVDDDEVETRETECLESAEAVRCTLTQKRAFFTSDPRRPFEIAPDIETETGLEIARAYRRGGKITAVRKNSRGYYMVLGATVCGGCSGILNVDLVREDGRIVRLDEPFGTGWGCVIPPEPWFSDRESRLSRSSQLSSER